MSVDNPESHSPEQEYPIPCRSCKKTLYGPVQYCPYCGVPAEKKQQKKEDQSVHDENKIFTITVSSGPNGRVSPESATAEKGTSQTFTLTPDEGYRIESLEIDGNTVDPVSSHTFESIDADHTIEAVFARQTFTIIYRINGKEQERSTVEYGSEKAIRITLPEGCALKDVMVNGASEGKLEVCRFVDVKNDYIVEALLQIDRDTDPPETEQDLKQKKEQKQDKKQDCSGLDKKPKWIWVVAALILVAGIAGYLFWGRRTDPPPPPPPERIARETRHQGNLLSVTISKLPNLEKVRDSARKLVEISPRYEDQLALAEETLKTAKSNRDKNLMAYLKKIVELARYSPQQVSDALEIIRREDLTPRDKIVIDLIESHVNAERNSGADPKKVLLDFNGRFSDFVD